MLAFAVEGVTSFSAMPLRMITLVASFISAASFVVTLWALWVRFIGKSAVPGWASTVIPSYFLGGIQLLCIGVIGEDVAKIYLETKRRPRFHIEYGDGLGPWRSRYRTFATQVQSGADHRKASGEV